MEVTYVLFVLVLFPSALLGQSINDRYEKFINQHINPGMNWSRCDTEIVRRPIHSSKLGLKKSKMCVMQLENFTEKNTRVSNQPFPFVTCKLKENHVFPNCKYDGQSAEKRIVIECEDGFPVVGQKKNNCNRQQPV
uniref:Ribonuclease A-domain domain-containing protein n=1 Tax=Periophthalmus magnuspinnatus TaxID=409849 RepID=A0A3B3ZYM5_9GOBI